MIHNLYGNNKDRTAQTLREQAVQNNVDTEWRQKFNELRSQYPGEDMLTLMDAASQAIQEAQTLEQQLADAIERTDATIAANEMLLASYRQECYEAGYSAFCAGDAGGYKPGRNCHWFEGYDAAAEAEYEACRENDDIGRDTAPSPWEW